MSRQQVRQTLREHLFGDGAASRKDDESEEEDVGSIADAARGMRRRLSRTSTMIAKRASVRRSLNPLSRSTTSLPRESSAEPEDEEEVVNRIREKAYRDKLASLNQPLQVTVEDDGVEETVISPIRRRSLMTPGLATRDPTDILAKPPALPKPSVDLEDDYYYNRKLSESSPLARIAALDLADELFDCGARSATPVDVDYGNLSGLGALRVTNGVASPAPSMHSVSMSLRKPSNDQPDDAEYFSLPFARHLEHRPSNLRLQEVRRSGEFADAYYEYAKRQSGEISRGDSNCRPTNRWSALGHEGFDDRSIRGTGNMVANEVSQSRNELLPADAIQNKASSIAESYMQDLVENPFAEEVTTKPNEIEDDLFEDQTSIRRLSLESFEPFTMENIFDAENKDSTLIQEQRLSTATIDMASNPLKHAEQSDRHRSENWDEALELTNTQADSGYSSGSSLRSLNDPLAQRQKEEQVESMLDYTKTAAPRAVLVEKIDGKNGSVRPRLVDIPTTTTTTTKSSLFNWSYQNSSDTVPTLLSTNTASSQSSTTARKLQKPRPKSQPPPVNRISIQSHPDLTTASLIPPIPLDVAERNAQRLRILPPLNHTLPSVDHEKVQPETATSPPVSAPVRFPTPSVEESSEFERSDPIKMRRRSVRQSLLSSSKNQGKPSYTSPEANDNIEAIATLGDVARSLGDGPYDAAFGRRYETPQRPRGSAAPHQQIWASMPKAKSFRGMNDHEALEVSRIRTMYRRSSLEAQPPSNQRPRVASYEGRQFNDRGGVPGKMPRVDPRPQHQPPLPSIPVAVQIQIREAQLAAYAYNLDMKLRPIPRKAHSMIVPQSDLYPSEQPAVDYSDAYDPTPYHRRAAGAAPADEHIPSTAPLQHRSHSDFGQLSQTSASTRQSLPPPGRSVYAQSGSRIDILRAEDRRARERQSLLSQQQLYPDTRDTIAHSSSTPNLLSTTIAEIEQQEQRAATTSPQPQPQQLQQEQQQQQDLHIPNGTVARLSGRFDGGLGYGYEHGFGVGGSAGTRSRTNKASRKSVQVSKGFGLDLSDIPVFIARHRA